MRLKARKEELRWTDKNFRDNCNCLLPRFYDPSG